MGQSIGICTLQSLIAGKFEPRIVARGITTHWQSNCVDFAEPSWSPDGKHIACIKTEVDAQNNVAANVCVVHLDGSAETRVTQLPANKAARSPTWCPGGSNIAFCLITSRNPQLTLIDVAMRDPVGDICVVSCDGTTLKRLTSDGASSAPVWLE